MILPAAETMCVWRIYKYAQDICYSDISACVGASNASFKHQETDCAFDFTPAFCWSMAPSLPAASNVPDLILRPGEHRWLQVHWLFTHRRRWA